jgi:putative transcriptional regulator
MTQQSVAAKAKIARSTYAMIESGERNASVPNAKKISKVLDLEWTIFFEDECHDSCNIKGVI